MFECKVLNWLSSDSSDFWAHHTSVLQSVGLFDSTHQSSTLLTGFRQATNLPFLNSATNRTRTYFSSLPYLCISSR